MVMMAGCGTNSSNDSRSISFKTQEYTCCRSISKVTHQGLWEAHGILSDGGTWYPEACNSLGLKHIDYIQKKTS